MSAYSRGGYKKKAVTKAASKKSYSAKYTPGGYGIRGAPSVSVGYGFRGDYTRSSVEKKYKDIAATTYGCDSTGSVTVLNSVDEGTGVSQRVGRKICMKSVQLRGVVVPQDVPGAAANVSAQLCRVMLVWDKQPNGVIATIANILSASTSCSYINLDYRERFVVLMDKHYGLGPLYVDTTATQTWSAVDKCTAVVNKYKRLPQGTDVIFDGTGGGIADINSGALLLVTIGTAAAGQGFNATLVTRIRYTDA